MKVVSKNLSDTKIELKIELGAKELSAAEVPALDILSKDLKIEGFRKGKVPADIAKKFIPENELNNQVIDLAIKNSLQPAFTEVKKMPLAVTDVKVSKYVPGESAEFVVTADILPEIKLGDWKNLKVKKPDTKISPKDVDHALEHIALSYANKTAVKRAAKMDDEVIIDFVGKKDGVAFDGGTAKDYKLGLGSHNFIPGFEEGIVGHEAGDKFNLELTFPKDYHMKDLAGKKTVFEVLLKQVNEVKPAALDDELAKKCGNFKTIAELKADIEKNLNSQKAYYAKEDYATALIKALVKCSKVAAPEIMVKDQLRLMKDDLTRNAASQGASFENYIGKSTEEWEKEATPIAEDRVKESLVLQILARDEEVTVEDKAVEAKIAELRDVYQKSAEALKNLKDPRVKENIKNQLVIEKTIDLLIKENDK